jgi:hypothetical protein
LGEKINGFSSCICVLGPDQNGAGGERSGARLRTSQEGWRGEPVTRGLAARPSEFHIILSGKELEVLCTQYLTQDADSR